MELKLLFFVLFFVGVVVLIPRYLRVVPQQRAYVVERLGRFYAVLQPGLNFIVPFIDTVRYKHDLREIPLDGPSQICITKDNTQLQVDGILYFRSRIRSWHRMDRPTSSSPSRSSRRRPCGR